MAKEIDAVAELDKIAGKGKSSLGSATKHLPRGAKALVLIAVAVGLIVLALLLLKTKRAHAPSADTPAAESHAPSTRIGNGGKQFIPARLTPGGSDDSAAAAQTAPSTGGSPADLSPPSTPRTVDTAGRPYSGSYTPSPVTGNAGQPAPLTKEEKLLQRRLGQGFQGRGQSGSSKMETAAKPASQGGASGSGELAENMQPVRFNAASAGVLPNRDLLVTQGEMIDCQLETKIVTTQAGQVTCYLTRDVYSTSKRVVMMEKGSKVVGQYQKGITQGQARIFVLWTRVETNKGVIINLDSSGAGPLGEAGLGGWVDNHFWERFGGAIMLSMIDDVGEFFSNKASGSSNQDRITFDNTSDSSQDMAAEVLKKTIDIPPTLYKNHGERIQIFVARDLDFSGVYSLERS